MIASGEEQLRSIALTYDIRGSDGVIRLLRSHPELVDLVAEARTWIAAAFGATQVALEVISEPESDFHMLQAFVVTRREPRDAAGSLDWLDSVWWLKASAASSGRFQINIELND